MRTTTTLKSNFWNNSTVEILTKEQQRQILGGTWYCTYRVTYSTGTYYQPSGGACAYTSKSACLGQAETAGGGIMLHGPMALMIVNAALQA